MSVVQNPLIGRARQSLGGTVFTTWKGINVIKGKPLSVANPRTDKQIMRRSALIQMVAIGRKLANNLNLGFKEQAIRKSAFNAFVSANLRMAFDYSQPPSAFLLDGGLVIAQGTISQTVIDSAVYTASNDNFTATWVVSNLEPGQSNADAARCVLHNPLQDKFFSSSSEAGRNTGITVFGCPADFAAQGETIFAYVFFYNETTRKSSDSYVIELVASA